jgi:RNA polymerase sigma-70 factor (sigma-E family)
VIAANRPFVALSRDERPVRRDLGMGATIDGRDVVWGDMTEELAVGLPAAGPSAEAVIFDDFVILRSDSLLRTAYLLTHDHALAEDLLQTALAKAWGAWRRIEGNHEGYVRRILVTTYATWWRRKWRGEVPTETLPEVADGAGPEDRIDLWTALGRLPRKQRAAVVLRYYEGLTEAETAVVLGCSVGTVKSQTSRALAKLRIDPALRESLTGDPTIPATEGGRR